MKVDWNNCFGSGCYCFLDFVRINKLITTDINKNWSSTAMNNALYRGNKGVTHSNDLVTRTNAKRFTGKEKSISSAIDSNRILSARVVCQILFKVNNILS